jgi:invasion protein IalB
MSQRLSSWIGYVLCLLAPSLAVGQTGQLANGTVFGNFTLQCEAETIQTVTCALVQTIVAADDRRFLAEVGVNLGALNTDSPNADGATMVIRTPSAMRLSVPPAYLLDSSTQENPVPWLTCAGEFCLAALPLDPAALRAVADASSLTAGYLPLNATAPLSFEVALEGLAAGLRALGAFPQN